MLFAYQNRGLCPVFVIHAGRLAIYINKRLNAYVLSAQPSGCTKEYKLVQVCILNV